MTQEDNNKEVQGGAKLCATSLTHILQQKVSEVDQYNNTAKFPETLRFHTKYKHQGMIYYCDQCNYTVKFYETFCYHMGS